MSIIEPFPPNPTDEERRERANVRREQTWVSNQLTTKDETWARCPKGHHAIGDGSICFACMEDA